MEESELSRGNIIETIKHHKSKMKKEEGHPPPKDPPEQRKRKHRGTNQSTNHQGAKRRVHLAQGIYQEGDFG